MRRALTLPLLASLLLARSASAAPSTTIVISEFRTTGPTGGNDEFIELFNLTNAPINVGGYKIAGSNASGSTSVRATLDAGTTIAARGFLLVVNSGGYSGAAAGDKAYTTGITNDGGVALLDPTDKVIDAVGMSAGSAYKEGTPLAMLPSGQDVSYRRKSTDCSPDVDTDKNSVDFEQVSPASPQNRTSCCLDAQCNKPPAGQCYPATGTCDAAKGTCSYSIAVGKSCNDGNACTEADVCLAGGACQGTTKACTSPPGPECINASTQRSYSTPGTCSSGACSYTFVDTACPCDAATGLCKDPCAGVTCTSPPNAQCYNAAGSCNTSTGSCSYTKKNTGTACNDGAACTEADKCDAAGTCVGTPKTCTPPAPECIGNSSRVYSGGACAAATGACTFQQADTACTFGCDAATGLCKPNPCAGVSCTKPPSPCHQSVGVCDPGTGQCAYTPKPGGTPCNDGAACTEGDVCNGAGVCAGSAKLCTPPAPECVGSSSRAYSGGACAAATGACTFQQADTACPNGCDAATGLCKNDPCAGVTCTKPPSPCHAPTGTCSGGACSYTLKPENAQCDDGDPCTQSDRCTAAGACVGSTLVCNAPPAPKCTSATTSLGYAPVGTCKAGTCSYTEVPSGCAFGCDASTGLCDGDPCADVTCTSPPSGCHAPTGSCSGGQCSYGLKQPGAACDDGDPCTVNDACDASGACGGKPKLCNTPPAPTCVNDKTSRSAEAQGACQPDGSCQYATTDTVCAVGCDASTGLCQGDPCAGTPCNSPPSPCHAPTGSCSGGQCSYAPLQAGAACDDGDPCTVNDACSAEGQCAGAAKVCSSPPEPECVSAKVSQSASAVGTCSPVDGSCGYDVIETPCATGCDLATGLCKNDPCAGVTCASPPSPCHMPTGQCSGGECSYEMKQAGAACDDGDPCTAPDACDPQGACKGEPSSGCAGQGGGGSSGAAGGPAGGGGAAGSQGGSGGQAGKGGSAGGSAGGKAGSAGQAGKGGSGAGGAPGGQAGATASADQPTANAPGCGCALPGERGRLGGPGALAAAALGLAALRRRSRGGAAAEGRLAGPRRPE